jgi:hypothetical protein
MGTECFFDDTGVVMPSGSPGDINLCEPNGGLPTGIMLPEGTPEECMVDFFIALISHNQGAGMSLSTGEQLMGGPAMDDEFGQSVMAFENCSDPPGAPLGTWGWGAFSAPTVSDARAAYVCTTPAGPCCVPAPARGVPPCEVVTQEECDARGGYMHDLADPSNPTDCGDPDADPDGDGFFFECDNCPDVSNPDQADCDGDGIGDDCDGPGDDDSDGDGCCDEEDLCDEDSTGLPDPGKCDPGQCGCNNDDIDSDGDCTADPPIPGCAGHCMDCVDECNNDPYACVLDDFCGCPLTPYDWDGDGVPNCEDQCQGIDDAIFAPDCIGVIPTVSEWGLMILALLLLVAGKVYFGRRATA